MRHQLRNFAVTCQVQKQSRKTWCPYKFRLQGTLLLKQWVTSSKGRFVPVLYYFLRLFVYTCTCCRELYVTCCFINRNLWKRYHLKYQVFMHPQCITFFLKFFESYICTISKILLTFNWIARKGARHVKWIYESSSFVCDLKISFFVLSLHIFKHVESGKKKRKEKDLERLID